jgi:mono/diheme cytochrome c family protein
MIGRFFKVVGTVVLVLLVAAGGFVAWRLNSRDPEVSAPDVASTPALVAQGAYLVTAADCAACHNGQQAFAGGRAFHLPFGTIYATNITPDRQTGIGTWSDDDFVRALHRGIAPDGTKLYPAFPYTSYTGLSRQDAVAMKAYLFSLKPVHAPAQPDQLAFPFNQRWAMAAWNIVFLHDHRFRPDPAATPARNRGAYLATALGHCGECHTPRNAGFATEQGRQFGGALLEGWRAYNITTDTAYGIGAWSDQQIADYLRYGHAAGHGAAAGPMGEAVSYSLQHLTPDDTAALVAYLRGVEPQQGTPGTEVNPTPATVIASTAWTPGHADASSNKLGARIFEGVCASCHAWNGAGRETPYAALAGSQAVNDPQGVNLVQVMLAGANLETGQGRGYMPSFRSAYSDAEIAAVANYVIGHFGGKTGEVTAKSVQQRRAAQPAD